MADSTKVEDQRGCHVHARRGYRDGNREYGTLALRYVSEFDANWLRGGAPVTRDAVAQVAAATLVPMPPLGLTMMSLEDLLKRLFGILFQEERA